jgi:hypothetical protein
MGEKEEGVITRVIGAIQGLCMALSIIQWIVIAIISFGTMVGVLIMLLYNPLFGILFGILLSVLVFAIIAIFVNRRGEKRMLENLEKELIIKEAGMSKATIYDLLPVVEFKISVKKNSSNLKLELQKLLLDLTCGIIPQKTFLWDRSYHIESLKEFPDIKWTDDGNIKITYPCMYVFYNHNYVHNWKLKGRITYHTKVGDITKEITLVFQLDEKAEEELKEEIKRFQKSYVEVEERGMVVC